MSLSLRTTSALFVLLLVACGSAAEDPVPETSAEALASGAQVSSCSGNACNGRDPAATGCSADARTVGTTNMLSNNLGNRAVEGFVELRWSDRCQTNWARVTRYAAAPNTALRAEVTRQDRTNFGTLDRTSFGLQTIWSPMVYAPDQCASAFGALGQIITGSGRTNCI